MGLWLVEGEGREREREKERVKRVKEGNKEGESEQYEWRSARQLSAPFIKPKAMQVFGSAPRIFLSELRLSCDYYCLCVRLSVARLYGNCTIILGINLTCGGFFNALINIVIT